VLKSDVQARFDKGGVHCHSGRLNFARGLEIVEALECAWNSSAADKQSMIAQYHVILVTQVGDQRIAIGVVCVHA
jgi:hypothetical protein